MSRYTYFISYSCYKKEMTVLLNGKQMLSSSSAILQYMNEPFYNWCKVLPELLYRELGEDYSVVYMGRNEESIILQKIFDDYPHCLKMSTQPYLLKQSLQERMIQLSKLIKDNQLTKLPQQVLKVVFLGKKETIQRWEDKIRLIDVKNQYCKVDIEIKEIGEPISKDAIVFCFEELIDAYKYVFILRENDQRGFIDVNDHQFIYGIDETNFFDVVFECLLVFPLAESFALYASHLLKYIKDDLIKRKVEVLLSVKPCIYIKVDQRIERGTSIPLVIETEPQNIEVPRLLFEYQVEGIVTCMCQSVFGEKEGRTKVKVYEEGSVEPLTELVFEVYERNRIQTIDLSDYSIVLGVGDTLCLNYSYEPANADNVDKIQWYSDHKEVANVSNGLIKACSRGVCKVYCAAEKTNVYCLVQVKPYMESLEVPYDEVHLDIGETKTIGCITEPIDSYDGKLIYTSTDLMVVNVSEDKIMGIRDGEADIVIENINHHFKKQIHVIVGKGKQESRKGFFSLFRKRG